MSEKDVLTRAYRDTLQALSLSRQKEEEARSHIKEINLRMENEKREMRLTFGEKSQEAEKSKTEEFQALLQQRATTHSVEIRKLEGAVEQLNAKLEETHGLHKETLEEKYSCESTIAQISSNLAAREEYLRSTKEDLTSCRAELKASEDKVFQLETGLHQLQLHVSALENTSSNSGKDIESERALRLAAENAADRTKESLDVYKNNNKTLTAKLAASSAEINKGNEVISKLSAEYRANKQKLKMKSELLRNQEMVMSERENTITKLDRQNQLLTAEVEVRIGRCQRETTGRE